MEVMVFQENMLLHSLISYIPSPFYMFVSPKHPRLEERLTFGLEKMVADGTLRAMFNDYYGSSFNKAKLHERNIINIGNPLLPEKTPLHRKELWLDILTQK